MSSIEFHPVPLFSRYFLADRVVEMTVEMFREPRKMVQEISGLGLRHVPQHPREQGASGDESKNEAPMRTRDFRIHV